MKLEQNEQMPLFSSTSLPDVFFTEYLPQANGNYIKIYLYILFLSKYDKDIKVNDLSKKLNLPLKEIQDAMKYWEDANVITKKSTGYILNNLQEIELYSLYKPKVSLSAEQIQKSAESQKRAQTIEYLNNKYFSGLMPVSWYPDIELWFKKFKFDEEVMIALFNYCFDKSALTRPYVQVVADAWSKNKIQNYSDLENYFEKQEKVHKVSNIIAKKLSLNRQLSQYEYEYIEKWLVDFEYDFDIIEIALKRTTSKSQPNFVYLDKLLTDWHERGFKTVEQIQTFLLQIKEKNKNIKQLEKQTNHQKFEQRTYDNLNNLYANKKAMP